MNIRKLHFFALASFCIALSALVLPVITNAQGRYANTYSKRDVSNIVAKLEKTSNEFRRDFDRNLDRSSINGTSEEDRLNNIVRDYEQDLNQLRREFNNSDTWWDSRSDVREVMQSARSVNQMMNNLPFARKLEKQWRNMRRDLNKLSDTYDLASLDGNDNGNGGGDVPSWAIGTFSTRNPETGGSIILTVNSNGSVIVNFDGRTSSATMNGTRLTNDGVVARVSRINNGIRTTRTDNGERIDYFRSGNGGDNGNGGGNVPNWAVGTFYGRNPNNGRNIILTIYNNGSVNINADGATSSATLNGETMSNNGITSRISKLNNGIRTTRNDNGERIDYYLNNSGGNNGGNNGNVGDVPSWAVGTFSTRNPENNNSIITLTINRDGSVVINFDGSISYATMYKDRLTNNGITSKVTKINNGIRTTRTDNGQRIDYYKNQF